MTPRFWHKKVRLRVQFKTDDVVYSGRLIEDSCRGRGLDIHTAINRQNRLVCELVIPVLVNVSFYYLRPVKDYQSQFLKNGWANT